MINLDVYISENINKLHILIGLKFIYIDLYNALSALPKWERGFHIFWLLGPFIFLIERSPADLRISVLALAFVVRSIIKWDKTWLKPFLGQG